MNLAPWKVKEIGNGTLAYLVPDAELKTNAGKMSATGTITTERVDLDGDIVRTKGIDLTIHRRNPQVLVAHQLHAPCGQAEDPLGKYTVKMIGGNKLDTESFFNKRTRMGEESFRLVEDKVLRGLSIGFPRSSARITKGYDADGQQVQVYESCVLMEYSILPFPSNPDCLISRVEKGYGGRQLLPELQAILRPYIPDRPAMVTSGFEGATVDKNMQQQDPMAPPMGEQGDEAGMDAGNDHGEVIKQNLGEIIMSVVSQALDGAEDPKAALEKIAHLIDTHEKLTGSGDDGELPDLDDEMDEEDVGDDDEEESDDDDPPAREKTYKEWTPEGEAFLTKTFKFLTALWAHPNPNVRKAKAIAKGLRDEMETLAPVEKQLQDGLITKSLPGHEEDWTDVFRAAQAMAERNEAIKKRLYSLTGQE